MSRFKHLPHPEERAEGVRLEGWATGKVLVPTLRDASLRDAPQGEVIIAITVVAFLTSFVTYCFDCIHFEPASESAAPCSAFFQCSKRNPAKTVLGPFF